MDHKFMRNITAVFRCAAMYREEKLSKSGLNGYQAQYVPEICKHPGITQDQLAQRLHVNRSNVTRQLAALEENGFITRSRCGDDKRAIEVFPTEKMLEIFPEVRKVFKSWREELTKGISEEEMVVIERALATLAQRAEDISK